MQMFVAEKARLLRPRAIYICDGCRFERENLIKKLRQTGAAIPLPALSDSYLVTTDPHDASAIPIDPIITSESREHTETKYFSILFIDFTVVLAFKTFYYHCFP